MKIREKHETTILHGIRMPMSMPVYGGGQSEEVYEGYLEELRNWETSIGRTDETIAFDGNFAETFFLEYPLIRLSLSSRVWPAKVGASFSSKTGRYTYCADILEDGDWMKVMVKATRITDNEVVLELFMFKHPDEPDYDTRVRQHETQDVGVGFTLGEAEDEVTPWLGLHAGTATEIGDEVTENLSPKGSQSPSYLSSTLGEAGDEVTTWLGLHAGAATENEGDEVAENLSPKGSPPPTYRSTQRDIYEELEHGSGGSWGSQWSMDDSNTFDLDEYGRLIPFDQRPAITIEWAEEDEGDIDVSQSCNIEDDEEEAYDKCESRLKRTTAWGRLTAEGIRLPGEMLAKVFTLAAKSEQNRKLTSNRCVENTANMT